MCINPRDVDGEQTPQRERVYRETGLMTTLQSGMNGRFNITEPIMVGHVDIKGNESIKRVYHPDGIGPCLTTMGGGHREPKILVKQVGNVNPSGRGMNGVVYDSEGLGPTITTNKGEGSKILIRKPKYRIRKLTPKECWRLQGFPDEIFKKAQAVNSNSQLYKQAGNSVTVNVIKAISKALGVVS